MWAKTLLLIWQFSDLKAKGHGIFKGSKANGGGEASSAAADATAALHMLTEQQQQQQPSAADASASASSATPSATSLAAAIHQIATQFGTKKKTAELEAQIAKLAKQYGAHD